MIINGVLILSYESVKAGFQKMLREGSTIDNLVKNYYRIIGDEDKRYADQYKEITRKYALRAKEELNDKKRY